MCKKSVNYSFKMLVVVAGLLCICGTPASAYLITQTFNFGMADTDWARNVNIAQLNLSPGGILNSVKILETVDWTAYLSGTNTDASASVKVTKEQAELQLFDSISGPSTSLIDQSIGYFNRTGKTVAPHTGYVFGDYVSTNSFQYNYTAPADTAQFLGSGFVPLSFNTYTQNNESTSGGGHFTHTQRTQADLTVQVVYDYSGTPNIAAVPEPSAGVLLGVGGLVCWGWRRKVARKA